mgnify:CR=1 FL=1
MTNDDSRLTKTKEQWARARRGGEEREVFYEGYEFWKMKIIVSRLTVPETG